MVCPFAALLLLHSMLYGILNGMPHYGLFYSIRPLWPCYLPYNSSIIP